MDIVIHKPIVNFGFKHMVATNFSAWLFILVQETVEAFEHHDDSKFKIYLMCISYVVLYCMFIDCTVSIQNHSKCKGITCKRIAK